MKSLDVEIIQYLSLLGLEEKKAVLSNIKSILKIEEEPETVTSEDEDFQKQIDKLYKDYEPTFNSREEYLIQYNKELDDAMAEIKAGNYLTQEELEKEMESW